MTEAEIKKTIKILKDQKTYRRVTPKWLYFFTLDLYKKYQEEKSKKVGKRN